MYLLVFLQAVKERQRLDPRYAFLFNPGSHEGTYYRWRTYANVMGDDERSWRDEPFVMFAEPGAPFWIPPATPRRRSRSRSGGRSHHSSRRSRSRDRGRERENDREWDRDRDRRRRSRSHSRSRSRSPRGRGRDNDRSVACYILCYCPQFVTVVLCYQIRGDDRCTD